MNKIEKALARLIFILSQPQIEQLKEICLQEGLILSINKAGIENYDYVVDLFDNNGEYPKVMKPTGKILGSVDVSKTAEQHAMERALEEAYIPDDIKDLFNGESLDNTDKDFVPGMGKRVVESPLGIMPQWLWLEKRLSTLEEFFRLCGEASITESSLQGVRNDYEKTMQQLQKIKKAKPMLKALALRPGNIVNVLDEYDNNKFLIVKEATNDCCAFTNGYTTMLDKVVPVQLNDKILRSIGFVKVPDKYSNSCFYEHRELPIDYQLYFNGNVDKTHLAIALRDENYTMHKVFVAPCQYLHKLQNLFYEITEKEFDHNLPVVDGVVNSAWLETEKTQPMQKVTPPVTQFTGKPEEKPIAIPAPVVRGTWLGMRLVSIKEAVERYTTLNKAIPEEWIAEYNELVEELKNNK